MKMASITGINKTWEPLANVFNIYDYFNFIETVEGQFLPLIKS